MSGTGVDFDSALAIGNDGEGGGTSAIAVDVDLAGNRYVAGSFMGTVDFDLGSTHSGNTDILTARGRSDAYVAKYAPDNSLAWVVQMGGDYLETTSGITDVVRSIKVDAAGTVAIAGEFWETSSFGSTTLVSAGQRDAFVAKLNANGSFQWVRGWGTAEREHSAGVGVDAAGNVYSLSSRYSESIEVRKFSASGNAAWVKSIHTDLEYGIYGALAVDPSGNVYVADNFKGTVDFDPSNKTKFVSSGSRISAYVLSLNTQGNFRWVSPMLPQAGGSSSADCLAWDSNGFLLVGGGYYGNVDADPGSATVLLPTTAGSGAFISKFSASTGALTWARAIEGAGAFVKGLDVDSSGGVYATGVFNNSADLDPTSGVDIRTSLGEYDGYVLKLTSGGSRAWTETIGGLGSDAGHGIAVSLTGKVNVVGYFSSTVDFDPDALSTYDLSTLGTRKKGFLLQLLQA